MFSIQNRWTTSLAVIAGLSALGISPAFSQGAGKGESSEKKSGSEASASAGDKKFDPASSELNPARFDDLKVSIDADSANLVATLRSLMKSIKANFVIDDSLNDGKVSINVKEIPFKTALKLLIKVSSLPIEWDHKDGIFHFRLSEIKAESKKDEIADPAKESLLPPPPRIEKIKLQNSDAKDTLDKLLGKNFDQQSAPIIIYDSTPPGRSRSNFFQFINGKLTSGSGSTGPNGAVQGGTQSIDVGRLLRQFLRFP